MLQIVNNKSVRGPHFTVTVPNVHKVEYAEDGKIATVEIEGGISQPDHLDWLVYVRTFSGWLPPHDAEKITDDQRAQILQNISQALSSLGMPNQLVEP